MPTEKTAKKKPQRTCIACRQMLDKRELCRVVRTPTGEIVLDDTGNLPDAALIFVVIWPVCKKLSKAGPTLVNAANVTEIASNGERPIAAIVNVPKPANRKISAKNLHGVQSGLRQNFFIQLNRRNQPRLQCFVQIGKAAFQL